MHQNNFKLNFYYFPFLKVNFYLNLVVFNIIFMYNWLQKRKHCNKFVKDGKYQQNL